MDIYAKAIGRLMTETEFDGLGMPEYYTRIFADKNSTNYMATLKPLSKLPGMFGKYEKLLCQCDRLDSSLLRYDVYEAARRLEGKYILFRPVIGNNGALAFDQEILDKAPVLEGDFYIPVPCFDLDALNVSVEQFESFISKFTPLNMGPAVSDEAEDKPKIIIAKVRKPGRRTHEYFVYGSIKSFIIKNDTTLICIDEPEKHKADFLEGAYVIEDKKDGLLFIPAEIVDKYISLLGVVELAQDSGYDGESAKNKDVNNDIDIDAAKQDEEQQKIQQQVFESNLSKDEKSTVSGQVILDSLKYNTQFQGLLYDDKDLLNFYVSVESSNFIILAGMSGTGKSKLVRAMGKFLGLDKYDGLKVIPVSPSWTDDSDILGYVDYKTMRYNEADIELVSFLKEAAEHRDRKYIVCFDEMNLARVEHYFSQFISILEDDETERELVIYNRKQQKEISNSAIYPPCLKIYDNVTFIGTINIDDSTLNLSDKILDRANVIKLKTLAFTKLKAVIPDCVLTDTELEFLTELHVLMQKENPKFGIGYRIISQMSSYINKLPDGMLYTRGEAFDRLITQRIITKIRGSEEQVGSLIGILEDEDKLTGSTVLELLEKYSNLSDFEICRNELHSKAKELRLYGYTV